MVTSATARPTPPWLGEVGTRLGPRRQPAVLAGGLAAVVLIALLLSLVRGGTSQPVPPLPCPVSGPCANPPTAPAFVELATWRSSEFGYHLSYDKLSWSISGQSPRWVQLSWKGNPDDKNSFVIIDAVPASERSPAALMQADRDYVAKFALFINPDPEPAHRVLGAQIGLQDGVGGAFYGRTNAAQGVGNLFELAQEAAGDATTSVAVTAVAGTIDQKGNFRSYVMQGVDSIVNSLRFAARGT
jgi:hypothetical protein